MKAIVCDKCGKVILIPDEIVYEYATGINRLSMMTKRLEIDLCDECADELVAAVREGKLND